MTILLVRALYLLVGKIYDINTGDISLWNTHRTYYFLRRRKMDTTSLNLNRDNTNPFKQ